MIGTILHGRNHAIVGFSLLVIGCSGSQFETTGSDARSSDSGRGSTSSTTASGDSGPNDATTESLDAGANPGDGEDGDANDDDDGVGTSTGRGPRDSGREGPGGEAGSTEAGAGGGDGGDALSAARAQCVQIINQDRATLTPPSPPLEEDVAGEACVDGQAMADFQANTAHSAFGHCKESAQDECPNWPGPPSTIMTKCLAQMWAEGPPADGKDNHWLNMSNAKYKKVACGFYQTPSGKWWATQDFY